MDEMTVRQVAMERQQFEAGASAERARLRAVCSPERLESIAMNGPQETELDPDEVDDLRALAAALREEPGQEK